jgi:hypothetical protein
LDSGGDRIELWIGQLDGLQRSRWLRFGKWSEQRGTGEKNNDGSLRHGRLPFFRQLPRLSAIIGGCTSRLVWAHTNLTKDEQLRGRQGVP